MNVKTSGYFNWTVIAVAIVCLLLGSSLILEKPIVAGILVVSSVLVLTTHYRLEIDVDRKICHDYLWLCGFRLGERKSFDSLDYLFIKPVKVSQRMSARVASTVVHKESFDGYLKFSNAETLHIATRDSHHALLKQLQKLASKLHLRVVDYTSQPTNV